MLNDTSHDDPVLHVISHETLTNNFNNQDFTSLMSCACGRVSAEPSGGQKVE